ncbi:MAG: divalent-cation tolerance protein CutA [Elusimicrobia bacterium]|nr:divalent-cation tolerance protein CutA [Elusimicrobiota bacterium]
MATPYQICFITAGDAKTAEKLRDGLLKNKLAACVMIIENVSSSYWWKGKIENSKECLFIVKTRKTLSADIIQFVKENHSYTVPETVFFEISSGNKDYLTWLGANTLFSTNISKDRDREKNHKTGFLK